MNRISSKVRFSGFIIICLILSLFIISCSSEDDTTGTPTAPVVQKESPVATPDQGIAQTITESPSPTPTSPPRGPDFIIDRNTKPGDTTVQGTGPASITIQIVDVSLVGEVKGQGKIEEDGTFEIEVTPVEGGNALGIQITDLTGSGYVPTDFRNNETYQNIPMIGLLVDFYYVAREE